MEEKNFVWKWFPLKTVEGSGGPGMSAEEDQRCGCVFCECAWRPRTSLRVAEVRQGHGVELPSVGDGPVQQTAAAARITAAQTHTHTETTKLSSTISYTFNVPHVGQHEHQKTCKWNAGYLKEQFGQNARAAGIQQEDKATR